MHRNENIDISTSNIQREKVNSHALRLSRKRERGKRERDGFTDNIIVYDFDNFYAKTDTV